MSSLRLPTEPRSPMPADLLACLREQDNPFDDFVQARRPHGSFSRRHVPTVNRAAFEKLQSAIERYRLDAAPAPVQALSLDDVPRSGVLLVLGPRGAGKTHLVHALQLHERQAVMVAPTHFEAHRPFAEYLLQAVVRWLQEESSAAGSTSVQRLADWFARKVAVQALYGMTEIEWLARQAHNGWSYWRGLLGWGSQGVAQQKELLSRSLQDAHCRTLHEACTFREQDAGELQRITRRQVAESETSRTIAGQIRRGLYLHLVQLAFEGNSDALFDFLCDGFTQIEAPFSPSRETLVEELLAALTELFLLVGSPIVFMFDALESLLSDPPDEKRCHAFFRGLAEVLDSHRGLPFFLFAEAGHWQQAQRFISSYAQQRLQQGLPTRGHGSLRQLDLPPVTAHDLHQLVVARMASALGSGNGLPKFETSQPVPFCHDDFTAIARAGADRPPLRQMLQALRDLYQERVFSDRQGALLSAAASPQALGSGSVGIDLKEVWQREYKVTLRRIESSGLNALAGPALLGLQKWLTHLAAEGAAVRGSTPLQSEIVTFGNNPTYGQLVRCCWRTSAGPHWTGVAFLLGQKSAMPRDLKEKLRMMVSPKPVVENLVVLWPHELDSARPACQQLPEATRKIWDELVSGTLGTRIHLRTIDLRTLAAWLTIEPWEIALREEGPISLQAAAAKSTSSETVYLDTIRHFLAEETGDLLPLVAPHQEPQHEQLAARA